MPAVSKSVCDVYGKLLKVDKSFDEELEIWGSFCYLGDKCFRGLDKYGHMIARMSCIWKKI